MKMSDSTLTIFPTELAKRRFERSAVLKHSILETARLVTFRQLLDHCERAARSQGLLTGRTVGPAELALRAEQTAARISLAPGQPLARLSSAARAALLLQLIDKFAFLADSATALEQWLMAHAPSSKLHGFGQLLQAWRSDCAANGIVDRFTLNAALLQLLEHGTLPQLLSENEIQFRAVRWFNPFEERLIAALKTRRGHEQVRVFSVLPPAHAEAAGDRLCAAVRAELGSDDEWAPWTEDFADAYETDDSNLLDKNSGERISFFVSADPYGEIEDAARRIAALIKQETAPEDIALILRDLSPCSDIIPDVFQRFGIPYYFRRGTPAAALPQVKALLALLAFPASRSRDRLCDLLTHPSVHWPGVDDPSAIARHLRKTAPPHLNQLPGELNSFFKPAPFPEQASILIEQHQLELPEEVLRLIDDLTGLPRLPGERMNALFEDLLMNVTLPDNRSRESGVWILNPMDAAGLHFRSVFIAGMDDRSFPRIPQADSLLTGRERSALRAFLQERHIPCPRLALPETAEALIQEEILFLTVLGTATESLTLSFTQNDTDGRERSPGEFFGRMRKLTHKTAEHGESFHTILPPESVLAEDEARQTNAWLSPPAPPIQQSNHPVPALLQWLQDHPEFSATALESLNRNRLVFFIENVLGIKPDRTHEDNTDPADRGSVIHDILEQIYSVIAEQSEIYAVPESRASVPLASNDRDGRSPLTWKISQQQTEQGIPLAVFNPAKTDEYLALARDIADHEFQRAEHHPSRHLGHRAVWNSEKEKLHKIIENIIRMDCDTAHKDNRYPALFEMKFDAEHNLPVTLVHGEETIRLKGKIDRIDLIFNTDNRLEKVLVIDYKSKSRNDPINSLEKKIALNLDCQLALYTFAAQEKLFGAHNTPQLNQTVQALYHLQERDLKKMTNHFHKKRLSMTPNLTEAFLNTLFSNVRKLRAGDLAADPLIAGYEDYSHICRTTATDPKDLLLSDPIQKSD